MVRGVARQAGLALVLSLAFMASGPAVAQQQGSQPKDVQKAREALKERRSAQEAAAARADTLKQRLQRHESKLAELRRKRIELGKEIQKTEAELSRLERRLARVRDRATRRRKALLARHGDVKALLMALQRLAHTPRAGLLAGAESPLATVRGASLMRRLIPRVNQRASALRSELAELAKVNARLAERQRAVRQSKERLKAKRDELARVTDQVQRLLGRTRQAHEQARARMKQAAQEAENLAALVERYERAQRRRTVNLVARLEAERRARQRNQARPIRAPTEPPELSYQSDPRGDLRVPVAGEIVRGYGEPNQYGQPSSGVTFAAREGGQVVAPLDGQVIFVGPFKGYGEVLILENGGGYTTVLAGLSDINVEVDDYVLAGEPIARARKDGSSGARVYLELRAHGEPVDPKPDQALQAASIGKANP